MAKSKTKKLVGLLLAVATVVTLTIAASGVTIDFFWRTYSSGTNTRGIEAISIGTVRHTTWAEARDSFSCNTDVDTGTVNQVNARINYRGGTLVREAGWWF
jgi:hypothetical protein